MSRLKRPDSLLHMNLELSKSCDVGMRKYPPHHFDGIVVFAVDDHNSLEARLRKVHSDFFSRAFDYAVVRVHPMQVVVEENDPKLMGGQFAYRVVRSRTVNGLRNPVAKPLDTLGGVFQHENVKICGDVKDSHRFSPFAVSRLSNASCNKTCTMLTRFRVSDSA